MFSIIGMIIVAVIILFLLGMGIRALTYRQALRAASGYYTTVYLEWERLAAIPDSKLSPDQRARLQVLDRVIMEMSAGGGIDPTKHAW
jgi:Tfp pilus assembly protein PilV